MSPYEYYLKQIGAIAFEIIAGNDSILNFCLFDWEVLNRIPISSEYIKALRPQLISHKTFDFVILSYGLISLNHTLYVVLSDVFLIVKVPVLDTPNS